MSASSEHGFIQHKICGGKECGFEYADSNKPSQQIDEIKDKLSKDWIEELKSQIRV